LLESEFGSVRFHREEALEDKLGVDSNSSSAPHIYSIERQQSYRPGAVVRTGGLPTMYVATIGEGTPAYTLAGFADAEHNFNKFVSEAPKQQIQTNEAAESRGLLCAEVVYGLSPSWWLAGASNVKLAAARHFFDEGHQDALSLAEKWWNRSKGDRSRIKISTTAADGAFFVSLPIWWAPVEGHSDPEIKLYRIRVSGDGSCASTAPPEMILR
jgi:hypothetical protein